MTIVQSASFTGVAANDARPLARVRMGQQLLAVAKDQARAYEGITGVKVPGSTLITASMHVHDGEAGVIIPIPLFQEWIGAKLYPSSSTSMTSDGWGVYHEPIQFVGTGYGSIRLFVSVATAIDIFRLRAVVCDSSLTESEPVYFTPLPGGTFDDRIIAYADVTATEADVNSFRFEAYASPEYNGGPVDRSTPIEVDWIAGVTWVGAPLDVAPYEPISAGTEDVIVPDATFYGPASSGYTPTQTGDYDDDRAISGYLAVAHMANDAMLYELGPGLPAGPNEAGHSNLQRWPGHVHGAATSVTTTSDTGDDIDQALLAVSFGVARNKFGGSGRFTDDEEESTLANWGGRIFGAQVLAALGLATFATLGYHPFRMPAANASYIHTGATMRLKWAALVTLNSAKCTGATVRGTLYDSAISGSGTASDLTTTTDGKQILSGAIDYVGSSAVDGDGEAATLHLQARLNTAVIGDPAFIVHSVCLYYEAG